MHARSATIHADPQRLDDGIRVVRDELMPAVMGLDGCVGLSMFCDRESGRCIVTTSWRSEPAMHGADETVRDVFQRAAEAMDAVDIGVDDWEVAVLHRAFMAADGSCARGIWLRCDPASLPEALDDLPLTLLPRIDDTEGFCWLSLLVDRTTGHCLMTGVYEDRRTLEVSRDRGEVLREAMAEHMGMEITEVTEFELPLHHFGSRSGDDRRRSGPFPGAPPPGTVSPRRRQGRRAGDRGNTGMYARSTTFRGDPSAIDDGIAYTRDKVLPAVRQMDGCLGLSLLVDRHTGRCIATTSWTDADAMHRSSETMRGIRETAVRTVRGEDNDVDEWSIDVLHRVRTAPEGAATRVIWTRGPAGAMDRVIEGFRTIVVPRSEHLPGFCSVSFLVDHDTGRSAIAATYESRQTMNRAKGQALAIREEFLDRMGMHVTDVHEYDLAIAHLRVPEMA